MKVCVVGSGLGGLLSALSLAKNGHRVTVFEKLQHPGGRFTNVSYKGFELSTGALHMIPHGRLGPLAMMLKSFGIDIKIVPSNPLGTFLINGNRYNFNDLPKFFSTKGKVKLVKLLAELKFGSGDDEDFKTWLAARMNNDLTFSIARSFCGFALSINIDEISSREMIAITKNINSLGGPGIPIGGCKGVTDALVREFEGYGKIHYNSAVENIMIKDGRLKGVATSKEEYKSDVVISNVGPKQTITLCGKENFDRSYIKSMMGIKEASGIKISIACDKAMIGHTGVLFTPDAKRIDGANEVTNADPALAPKGKHLLMTHQTLRSDNIKKEMKLGIEDLHEIFPSFEKHCEILLKQVYKNGLPVNRAQSGEHISPETPIKGLYLVGDAVKPEGFMETEGVAKGVEMMLNRLGL